jgi:hypothetical protein|nr:hypothetical protein [uncultured Prevotella sp.]
MESSIIKNRRKVIDIKGDTFRSLSVMAASRGTNLKKFIESILDHVAETNDDNKLYTWLIKNVPEGKKMAGKKEQEDFEKWLGV